MPWVNLLFIAFEMSQQADRAQVISIRKMNRFRFSDYRFAEFVRKRMSDALVQFDVNANHLFEENEIREALLHILNEDPNEIYYVVQNVFRYDKDNDKRITYKEFIDFSVEQHFGELAIQRLHKQKLYSQGSKRIMNLPEFMKTMEYSLNCIGIQGSNQIYSILFNEVDLDEDGFISYEDYFVFLKEYFGSLSEASEQEEQPQQNIPNQQFAVDNGAAERFARLVYSQLKISVMMADRNRNLQLEMQEIYEFLAALLKLNDQECENITQLILRGSPSIGYDEFLQFFVPFYFCEFFVNERLTELRGQPINEQLFVEIVSEASSSFVAVPPSEKTIKSIYFLATGGSTELDLEHYVMLMGTIFQNFSFDKRGLARGSSH